MARENLLLVSRSVIAIQDKYFQVLTNTVLIDFFQFFLLLFQCHSCSLCIRRRHLCKHVIWKGNNERITNQYAALLLTQCGCVR